MQIRFRIMGYRLDDNGTLPGSLLLILSGSFSDHQILSSQKHVRIMYSHPLILHFYIANLGYAGVSVPIFSSPEPLGSQGELIGWP